MTLEKFAKDQYEEIVNAYSGETPPVTLEQFTEYIKMWTKENELTPAQTIAEFNWSELTMELGLV